MALSRRVFFAIIAALVIVAPDAQADDRRYKIEAAYVYNFFNYITWPGFAAPSDMAAPVICLTPGEPVLPYLNYIGKKKNEERHITLRTVQDGELLTGCHVFYSSRNLSEALAEKLRNAAILSVLSKNDAEPANGMIELFQSGERIAMRINHSDMSRSGFQTSSRLLALAEQVK